MRPLPLALLPLLVALGCHGDGPDSDLPLHLQECTGTLDARVGVVTSLTFARVEDGVSEGFDLDNHVSEAGDDEGCGIPDLVGPNGEPGVDNAFARLLPALESTEAAAVEPLIQQSIRDGVLLLLIELEDYDDPLDDVCVDFTVLQGLGEPFVSAAGEIVSGQTFDRDPNANPSTVEAVSLNNGALQAGPLTLVLPFTIFDVSLEIQVSGAIFGLTLSPDGHFEGLFGGGLDVDYLLRIAQEENVDPDLYGTLEPLLRAASDLDLDGDGECSQISITFQVSGELAFLFPE